MTTASKAIQGVGWHNGLGGAGVYRCTRSLSYEVPSSHGHTNASERKAVYITASSREMALIIMARRFPHDCVRVQAHEAFTADLVPNQRFLNHLKLNDYLFAGA